MGVAAGICAIVVARGCARGVRGDAVGRRASAPALLLGHSTAFTLHPEASRVNVRTLDGTTTRDLELALVVDGVPRPIEIGRDEIVSNGEGERGVKFHV